MPGTITRYAATCVNRDGMRTLMRGNQAHSHWDSAEDAQKWLDAVVRANSEADLKQCWGEQAIGTFEVRPVECYAHGDAIGVYFDVSPLDPITEIEQKMLALGWTNHKNLEQLCNWQIIRPKLAAQYPNVLEAWEGYQQSVESAHMRVEDAFAEAGFEV